MKIKNLFFTILSVMLVATFSLPFVVSATSTVAVDINKDGTADINDVTALQKYIVGKSVEIDVEKADVNADGKIDIRDATALQKALNNTTSSVPATEIPKETEDIGDLV